MYVRTHNITCIILQPIILIETAIVMKRNDLLRSELPVLHFNHVWVLMLTGLMGHTCSNNC